MMNLKKDKWKTVRLSDVCVRVETIDQRRQNGIFNYIDIGSVNSDLNRINKIQELDWGEASSRARQIIRKNDTLFSTVRVNLQRVALVESEIPNGIASTGFTVLRANEDMVHPLYIFYNAVAPIFLDKLIKLQVGTAYPAVTDKMVLSQEIPLPPLDEQERIVELFQSVEQAIVHAEGQEKNLRRLCKSLIDGLISNKPSFGNLLIGKKLKRVRYCDVAQKLTRRINPVDYGIERIVAGENLEAEDFKIRTWGTVGKDFLGPAFHVLFQAGDILYGSRRTYLKKVALADFEGVCANTTYVIRANEEFLLQDLLKHVMLSERFTQYSIGVSKGSTNPYINWKDLDNFTFDIPELETQRIIVDLLDEILANAEKLRQQKETLKKLKQKLLNEILG
ncbi:MAG: restriction endonuclease subunit S [Anaerolineales bacterium]|nr:MAG: restriction endonuclease subunit S [Anaerolineales bacterium]